jgi:hypothetical protein
VWFGIEWTYIEYNVRERIFDWSRLTESEN